MILYSISGVIPHATLGGVALAGVKDLIRSKMAKTHPDCNDLQSDIKDEDIVLTFENDGIYYQLDIEA